MKHFNEKLCNLVRDFRSAQGGHVAITFGLALIPIFGLVFAGIDYSRASSARSAMQSAIDSAALMLSRDKDLSTLGQTRMKARARQYFLDLYARPEATILAVDANFDSSTRTLTMTASATVDTTFTRVIGHNIPIGASATVKWGTKLRVALALDNTGSMASAGKIAALKAATKSLLSTLQAAALQNGDIYVSIIPFSKDVNVGASNHPASWVDWTEWDDLNGTCTGGNGWGWGGWDGWSEWGWGWSPTRSTCNGTWTPKNHNAWNGCVMDRGQATPPGQQSGYDQKIDPPIAGNAETQYPAEQYGDCPVAMKGLSYDWTAMNSLVDSMYPNGSTNQPIGLVWAWQSLVGGGPLTIPPQDPTYQKAIILMSDGLNTKDRWYGNGSTHSPPVDHRMVSPADKTGTCKNIKDAKIVIYTVQVNTGGDPVSTLLQDCASPDSTVPKGPKFFHLTSANQMVTTFDQIAKDLAKLRIAR